ncbi:MAG: DUF2075 domain-containing protein [Patescibacteria group bacterium]
MIVYQNTKENFLNDILSNNIDNIINNFYVKITGRGVSPSEKDSWKNSMMYMNNVLLDQEIPADSGITVEYQIPQTSKRIDFIISGQNEKNTDHAILIELKQWSKAELTSKDGIVSTYLGGGLREVSHPSYQAWSYYALLKWFNETVYEEGIELKPCAYLHNYEPDGIINNQFYAEYIERAPLFLKNDLVKLRTFIKQYVKYGDKTKVMYRVDGGKIKPSKHLSERLSAMLTGKDEFVMIDDQKIVYETAFELAKKSSVTDKHVLIVEGGPGTGKTVVAVNLLVKLTALELNARYVTKNAAPRAVYESKLTGTMKKTEISNLFTGSGSFVDAEKNTFDVLIVDEAHRLNAKSGLFKNLGENQIKEIIEASKFSVFFIDEDQKVTLHDIGEKEEIEKWAKKEGTTVHNLELASQFRCNGSDGYLSWIDDVLQIKETANTNLDNTEYDFKVVDSPLELRDIIFEKNKINNKARLVAGYCWDWVSKGDKNLTDINFPEYDFAMKWNLASDGNLWIIAPESVNEVGCIHTSQGLEADYIGVIVGPDLVIREGKVYTDPSARASTDASIKGYKGRMKVHPEETLKLVDVIIKNTYRTLLTRGMKGCYVYFTDKETGDYFKSRMK